MDLDRIRELTAGKSEEETREIVRREMTLDAELKRLAKLAKASDMLQSANAGEFQTVETGVKSANIKETN